MSAKPQAPGARSRSRRAAPTSSACSPLPRSAQHPVSPGMMRSVDAPAALLEIAKIILSEDDDQRTPEIILRRVLEFTGASRGFIVVKDGEDYEQKVDIRFDRAELSNEERRFSRSMVRLAITKRELIYSPN